MPSLRRASCTVLLSFAVTGATGSASHAGSLSARLACPRYLIIDTRGSGEPLNTVSPPGKRFVEAWRGLHPTARTQVVTNPYPAPGWRSFTRAGLKLPGAYHSSVVKGKQWLAQFLTLVARQAPACAEPPRILLLGYSQGAQITADVVQQHGVDLVKGAISQILGVALFGDPYFNSLDPADRGGFERGRNGWLGKRALFQPFLRKHILSYCHAHDLVCQGLLHNGKWLTSQHRNYDSRGEPYEAARYFTTLAAQKPLTSAVRLPGCWSTSYGGSVRPQTWDYGCTGTNDLMRMTWTIWDETEAKGKGVTELSVHGAAGPDFYYPATARAWQVQTCRDREGRTSRYYTRIRVSYVLPRENPFDKPGEVTHTFVLMCLH